MSTYYWAFWFALTFLSRIPGPYLKRIDSEVQRAALWFYPVVGAILGVFLVGLIKLCFYYNPQASVFLVGALVLALWVYFTGAMHLDGLADMADAWVGGLGDHERTLEIMKDPRVGAMAVAAMIVVLLVKFAAITALLSQTQDNLSFLFASLLLIPMLARSGIIGLMACTPYVRKQGMVTPTQSAASLSKFALMSFILAVLTVPLLQAKALFLFSTWFAVLFAYRAILKKRLGGYTGDTLGAAVELQETLLLVALAL